MEKFDSSRLSVLKFGGTSVGTPERIRSVARRIADRVGAGEDLCVVVSAMGRATDDLIDLAHQVSARPPHREMDMLLTAGERISMALLSMALADFGVAAVSFTGSQSGIITDGSHRRARIKKILGNRIRETIVQKKVAIVAGFQGVSETKEITTLGRGGSDTTAVALAHALGARQCEIYTDVDGVFSADPRIVEDARFHSSVPGSLLLEMTVRGAGVLHPRSVEMAVQTGVRVLVKNSLKSEDVLVNRKSEILNMVEAQAKSLEEFKITGVTSDANRCLMTVRVPHLKKIENLIAESSQKNLSLLCPQILCLGSETVLRGFIEREAQDEWAGLASAEFQGDLCPVSVVGYRVSQDLGCLAQVLHVLSQAQISVQFVDTSALAITLGIPLKSEKDTVQRLHLALFAPTA